MKAIIGCLFFVLLGRGAFCQEADRVFSWERGDSGLGFWTKAINCGTNSNEPGGGRNTQGSKVSFGVSSHQRFAGVNSVEFWTNSSFEEKCNQNFSAERSEMFATAAYRGLGVREGQSVWFGFSDLYTDIDWNHSASLLQFRSNCGSGSPATEIVLSRARTSPNAQAGRLYLSTLRGKKYFGEAIEENVWYDWVIEIKYSKESDGYLRIWRSKLGASQSLSYATPLLVYNGPTMRGSDNCPHLRWGIYRWESGDKKPWQIQPQDRMMVKYISQVKLKVGNNLGIAGFRAVSPIGSADSPPLEEPTPSSNASIALPFYLNAGGEAYSEGEKTFLPDQSVYWHGGSSTGEVIRPIEGSESDPIYQSTRWGKDFAFRAGLFNGRYTLRLRLSELFWQEVGKREFEIQIEGNKVADRLDLFRSIGAFSAWELVFDVVVVDQQLDIEFKGLKDQATISGLLIEPHGIDLDGQAEPLRINAGGGAIAVEGVSFTQDQYQVGESQARSFSGPIEGTSWQKLYESAREASGRLSYAIPAPRGDYTLRFHLGEREFAEAGNRAFHVALEGQRVVWNLDPSGQVGFNEAIVGQAHVYVADGILNLDLVPIYGKPILYGLELIPQGLYASDARLSSAGLVIEEEDANPYPTETGEFVTARDSGIDKLGFSFFPNPASHQLSVRMDRAGTLKLQGLTGQGMRTWRLKRGGHSLELSGIAPGLYVLSLKGRYASRILVVGAR